MNFTAHHDNFAREHLPPRDQWPLMNYSHLGYPDRLNCAVELLDRMVAGGFADRPLFHLATGAWSYGYFLERVNQIAHVLTSDFHIVPGNRVLLRGPNSPLLAACWFAVLKAGGICVTTMPLLRSQELAHIIDKAQVKLALCAHSWMADLVEAQKRAPLLQKIVSFGQEVPNATDLESRMSTKAVAFDSVLTSADDVALIGFTSGTTGKAKATMHFHRDVMAICDSFPKSVLKPSSDDVFCGTPPLAFTFGLGGLLLFPMRVGASTVLLERASTDELLTAIDRFKASICFSSPTAYRAMLSALPRYSAKSLRKCVSAGETLPRPTFEAWEKATGIRLIDGIGATEMLHIFISAADDDIRPGATGKALPGYEARIMDAQGNELPRNTVGLLAVRGPTGCRYLEDPTRQMEYVRGGWNYTGDAYLQDADGYFWFQARADDMIISAGYNISGPEVESALLSHAAVKECAVVAAPDEARGHIVKAFIVLHDSATPSPALISELQNHAKAQIAPYKYPRAIEFVQTLPRTETGKLQRFRLRQ